MQPLTLLAIVSHVCVIGILSIDIHQNYVLKQETPVIQVISE